MDNIKIKRLQYLPNHLSPHCPFSFAIGNLIDKGRFSNIRIALIEPGHTLLKYRTLSNFQKNNRIGIALKIINKKQPCEILHERINHEVAMNNHCTNLKYAASFYFVFETNSSFIMGIELCPNGNLSSIFAKNKRIPRNQVIQWLAQLALALSNLHSLRVIYNHLKPRHICLDWNYDIKLVDFSDSQIITKDDFNPVTQRCEVIGSCGCIEYAAPEIFWREPHAFESDWWSYGVVAYEMLCGTMPFSLNGTDEEKSEQICSWNVDFKRNRIVSPGSILESFIMMFLQRNRAFRFGYLEHQFEQLMNHEIFRDIEWHHNSLHPRHRKL